MSFAAFSISLGLILLSLTPLRSQEPPVIREITIRGFLHDPIRLATDPWLFRNPRNVAEEGSRILWRQDGLSEPVVVKVVDNQLHLFRNENELAARTTVSPSLRSGILVVVPAADPAAKIPYRMLVLDESPSGFPSGTSKALNLVGVDAAVKVGKRRTLLPAGKITPVPAAQGLDAHNTTQVEFFVRSGELWNLITERRLQFGPDDRRVWLVYTTPGRKLPPRVYTIPARRLIIPPPSED